MEATGPLAFAHENPLDHKPSTIILRETDYNTGSERQGHTVDGRTNNCHNPQGSTFTCEQVKGDQGGRTEAGHGIRSRHMARGVDTSGGGWRVTGVVEVQVDDVTYQERRWGAGL